MITVNGREIEFKKDMTLSDALMATEESTNAMTLVILDGKLIPWGQPYKEPLLDGSEIKLLPIICGG